MKRILVLALVVAIVVSLAVGLSTAMAAKPQKAIEMSNGMPSGDHETLNIHGKKADYQCVECVPCATCDPPVQCNVVNIPEYTSEVSVPVTITYVSGRKVKIDELTVFDSCAGFDTVAQEDGAEVWLPYEAEGYWVFARALGKPAKGNPNDPAYTPRQIIFQNAESDNPMAYSLFGDVTEPGDIPLMMPLGLITKNGTYKMVSTEDMLVRFDSEPEGKGRGNNQGKDITDMFMWSGWVFQPILDLNGDGAVNELDVEYACWSSFDTNADGIIDAAERSGGLPPCVYDLDSSSAIEPWDGVYDPEDPTEPNSEFETWLDDNIPSGTSISDYFIPLWAYYDPDDPVWVFTIADMVYQNQVVINEGIKNLQIRFYPVDSTEFTPAEPES
jgi:hypothetical protein